MAPMTTAPPRAPRRDAAANREAILTAAQRLLARDPETPLDDIVREAGLTRRAFYGHFPSRDAMRAELARSGASRVGTALVGCVRDDARLTLALIAARLWSEVADVLALIPTTVRGPLSAEIAEPLAPLRALLVETTSRGARAGELRSDIEAGVLARLLEQSAVSALDEAGSRALDSVQGRLLVIRSVLSTAGLSWRETAEFIAAHPELLEEN